MQNIIITNKEEGQRFDKYLQKHFNKATKSFIYKMLRIKRIKLNGQKASGKEILKTGDEIKFYIAPETMESFKETESFDETIKIEFKKLYEDGNILVINKPSGLLCQKDSNTDKNSLIDQVCFYLYTKGEYDPNSDISFRPALVNRLDRNTSGIVIVGKTVRALQTLGEASKNNKILKYYNALVKGESIKKQTYTAYLTKDRESNLVNVTEDEVAGSKKIVTTFETIRRNEKFTLLSVLLYSGKPHQIRAHLAFLDLPIVGDKKYGHKGTNMTFLRKYKLNNQFLHASKIVFKDLEGDFAYLNEMEISCKLPVELAEIVDDVF